MHRREPAALGLAVTLLLAGCLGGFAAAPAPTGPPEAAWDEDGSLNETRLVRGHFVALRAAGSFSRNHTASIAIDGDVRPEGPTPDWFRPPSTTHERVDLAESRLVHVSVHAGLRRSAKFVSPDVEADRRRPCPPGECAWEYDFDRQPDGDTFHGLIDRYRRDRIVEQYAQVLDDWDFTHAGTARLDGEAVHRYTAAWTFDRPVPPFVDVPNGTGILLVTEDGVVRRWETTFSGSVQMTTDGTTETVRVTQRSVHRFYAVGETGVERPAWVDRARAGHDPPRTETGDR